MDYSLLWMNLRYFCDSGVKYVIVLFYYLRMNGLVERFVRSFKVVMKKYSKVNMKEINFFFMIY